MKHIRKMIAYGLAAALTVTSVSGIGSLAVGGEASAAEGPITISSSVTTKDVAVPDAPAAFKDLDVAEIIDAAGAGWNLGNTLDAWQGKNFLVNETAWQPVVTTKAIIKAVHDAGFNTIRIPVTYGASINDDKDYAIDEEWMSRIQEVVDYAISEDMYVILNMHHDGCRNDDNAKDVVPHGWLNVDGTDEEFAAVKEKYIGTWKHIAERFKNYDEHLMLAAMNEVFGDDPLRDGNTGENNGDCLGWKPEYKPSSGYPEQDLQLLLTEFDRIAQLNQAFVDLVRESGGNNAKRWLVIQPHNTQAMAAFDEDLGFEMPEDSVNRLMMEIHNYDKFEYISLDESKEKTIANQFSRLKSEFVDQGVPVIVGEWGYGALKDRSSYFEGMSYLIKKYNLIGCVWDNNGTDGADGYRVFDRENMQPEDDCIAGIMRGTWYNTSDENIVQNKKVLVNQIVAMTDMEVDTAPIELKAGESTKLDAAATAPENTNDTIVWSSSNAAVASVYHGTIRANLPGTAVITAKALSGNVSKEITVTVKPQDVSQATTDITLNYSSLNMSGGQEVYLTAAKVPADNEAEVRFYSEDESVANVSCDGRVLVKGSGTTNIVAATTDGFVKKVPLQAGGSAPEKTPSPEGKLKLAMYIRYNVGKDDTYYGGSEVSGDVKEIAHNGSYTLSFDCAKDLSAGAADKGVKTLNGIGALYLADYDVKTAGTAKKSDVPADTQISYTSIKVNGTELLTAASADYPAVKNGIFDTGNPLNAWDGSISELAGKIETTEKDPKYVSFPGIDNPTKIDVTFTIKGYKAAPTATVKPTNAPKVTPSVQPTATPKSAAKPKKVSGLKLKAAKKSLTVSWKKQSGMKYKVAYSTSKSKLAKLKNKKVKAKGVKVVNASSPKKVIKKLKSKKKYYVKVCAYTKVNKKTVYGSWSAVKNKKVK